jgi:hypothetical protein
LANFHGGAVDEERGRNDLTNDFLSSSGGNRAVRAVAVAILSVAITIPVAVRFDNAFSRGGLQGYFTEK